MKEKPYPYTLIYKELKYEFESVSEQKTVKKVVLINETEVKSIYNLSLLDQLDEGVLCDLSESRNKDLERVMATTIRIILDFFEKSPASYLLFTGSDARRQRLYSIIIGRELSNLSNIFEVFGVIESVKYPFIANQPYEFYLIKKKS